MFILRLLVGLLDTSEFPTASYQKEAWYFVVKMAFTAIACVCDWAAQNMT